MSNKNATEDKQDANHDLLVETVTTVKLLNTRLFGGDGQVGALPNMLQQHEKLTAQLDTNRQALLDRIDSKKKEIDEDVKALAEKHESLNIKVNWFLNNWPGDDFLRKNAINAE